MDIQPWDITESTFRSRHWTEYELHRTRKLIDEELEARANSSC